MVDGKGSVKLDCMADGTMESMPLGESTLREAVGAIDGHVESVSSDSVTRLPSWKNDGTRDGSFESMVLGASSSMVRLAVGACEDDDDESTMRPGGRCAPHAWHVAGQTW